jgi:hypothetical protein
MSPPVACKLGACEVSQGKAAGGVARIKAAVEREPETAELYDIWVAAAMLCGDVITTAQVAERRLQVGQPTIDSFVVAAGLQARLNRWNIAASFLLDAMRQYPGDTRLPREWKIAVERANSPQPR